MSIYTDDIKVIEILDKHSLLINYGFEDGAEENEKIRIISKGPKVIDPDTKEVLGTLDSIKATLTIDTVYDKFSLCKKITTTTTNPLISPLAQLKSTTKTVELLDVEETSITNRKAPSDNTIKVGDKVEIL